MSVDHGIGVSPKGQKQKGATWAIGQGARNGAAFDEPENFPDLSPRKLYDQDRRTGANDKEL
jgi:hypothetical protein